MCPSYLLCIHSFLIQPCITYFGSLSKHTQFRALGQLNYEERVAQIRTLTYYRWSFCLTRSRAAYHVTNVTKVYAKRGASRSMQQGVGMVHAKPRSLTCADFGYVFTIPTSTNMILLRLLLLHVHSSSSASPLHPQVQPYNFPIFLL